jgi:carbon-monoxide dehydrogenase medium subunit
LPDFDLQEALTLEEASDLVERYSPDARLLAGGTDLLVDLKTGRITSRRLVSINRIDALRGVSMTDRGMRIGALVTPTDLSIHQTLSGRFDAIRDATRNMAARQIRNVATVGGNISSAVPCADLPPILMAMNATAVLRSSSRRREVPLDSFFLGPRETVLQRGEVLEQIFVPVPAPRFGAAYERFSLRDGNAIAVAGVAAALLLGEDNTIRDARIVLGAVAPIPTLASTVASNLIGQEAEDEAFATAADLAAEAAAPISDVRGSADFRRDLVRVLTRRALAKARERAHQYA